MRLQWCCEGMDTVFSDAHTSSRIMACGDKELSGGWEMWWWVETMLSVNSETETKAEA